jgi:hypothetical protein
VEQNGGGSSLVGRRRTLQLFGIGLGVTSVLALEACSKGGGGNNAVPVDNGGGGSANSCSAALDDTSKNMRKTLQYADKAAVPEKHCSACAQYTAGVYGDCGSCKLFTGPVNPNGGCLSFAPKGAEGGTAAPAKST